MDRLILILMCLLSACGTRRASSVDRAQSAPKIVKPLPKAGEFYTDGLSHYAQITGLQKTNLDIRIASFLRRTIVPSAAFECLSREYAARFGADGVGPDPLTAHALAHHCGFWSLPKSQFSITAGDIGQLELGLRALPDALLQGPVGIGTVAHPSGQITTTILIPPSVLKLNQLSRHGPFQLSGKVIRGDGKIEFWSQSRSDSAPSKLLGAVSSAGEFNLSGDADVGQYRLEVVRVNGFFRQTIALFQRGSVRPTDYSRDVQVTATARGATTPFSVQAVVRELNTYRQQNGIPPLTLEPHLTGPLNDWLYRVAQDGGATPPTGLLDDRGWLYPNMLFGFSHGRTPATAVRLMKDTPTGQHLLRNRDENRVGVGFKVFPNRPGADLVVVLLDRFQDMNPSAARGVLLQRINQIRSQQNLPKMELADSLSRVSQKAVAQVLAGHLDWQASLKSVVRTIEARRLATGGFNITGLSGSQLDQIKLTGETILTSRTMKYIGIGILGGPLPGQGTPRYLCILTTAQDLPKSDR